MERPSASAGQDSPPSSGTLPAAAPWSAGQPTEAPAGPVDAARERLTQAAAAVGTAAGAATGAAVAARDAAVERAGQVGVAISSTVGHTAEQVSEAATVTAAQVTAGTAQMAGSVSARAVGVGTTASATMLQGLMRARRFVMERPVVLLGGAFVIGIVIARLV